MELIKDPRSVLEKVEEGKKGSRDWVTNYFPNEDALGYWISIQRFYYEKIGDTVFFFRSDSDFLHLHYVSPSYEELGRGLQALVGRPEILVADVITNEEARLTPIKVFQDHGFHLYSTLARMSKLGGPSAQSMAFDQEVRFAEKKDGGTIRGILVENFDRFAEQIPSVYEIERDIERNHFLVCEIKGILIGLLHFENVGLTSHLKRWFVDENYRGRYIGSKFLRSYHFLSKNAKRFILWVIDLNENAVKRYSHYDYQKDGLVDTIYVNKGHLRYGK